VQDRSSHKPAAGDGSLMRPFTVILGILLGSLVSIVFSLSVVVFLFWWLEDESPLIVAELPDPMAAAVIFMLLASLAGGGFYGVLRRRGWRYPVLALLWGCLAGAAWYYWPP